MEDWYQRTIHAVPAALAVFTRGASGRGHGVLLGQGPPHLAAAPAQQRAKRGRHRTFVVETQLLQIVDFVVVGIDRGTILVQVEELHTILSRLVP